MLRFIDLFAGIGGMRIPFENSQMECVFSSEWDAHAAKVYEANFGEIPAGDISKIDVADVPNHDLLLAGFPCQPFSHAGHKKGFADTRGTLFFEIARIVEALKPKVLLLENVRGLISHGGGETFKRIIQVLEDLGFVVHWKILNAKDFGVPQNRPRVFIVAINQTLDGASAFEFPKPTEVVVRVGQILEEAPSPELTISDRLWAGHQRRREAHRLKGNGFGYSMVDADSQATRTLSARYYKDGSEILVRQNGQNPRKISVREAANLQGFPADFVLAASKQQAYKQLGNSVAVPVIEAIRDQLLPFFSGIVQDKSNIQNKSQTEDHR